MLAQQRDQADQVDAALQFGSGVLKVDRGGDARLGGEQILCRACRRHEERHLSVRGGRGDSADERQMPDDVADSWLDLNDRKGRHVSRHCER